MKVCEDLHLVPPKKRTDEPFLREVFSSFRTHRFSSPLWRDAASTASMCVLKKALCVMWPYYVDFGGGDKKRGICELFGETN